MVCTFFGLQCYYKIQNCDLRFVCGLIKVTRDLLSKTEPYSFITVLWTATGHRKVVNLTSSSYCLYRFQVGCPVCGLQSEPDADGP